MGVIKEGRELVSQARTKKSKESFETQNWINWEVGSEQVREKKVSRLFVWTAKENQKNR